MDFHNDGITLSYGWAERAAPEGTVSWVPVIPVPVVVRPSHPRNIVFLRYRVNNGPPEAPVTVTQPATRRGDADFFELRFHALRPGDSVDTPSPVKTAIGGFLRQTRTGASWSSSASFQTRRKTH